MLRQWAQLGIIALPLVLPLTAPLPSAGGQAEVIKIVSSLPRTGSAKGQTDSLVNAIRMAFEEVSYQVGSFTIEYQDLDDATPERGAWDAARERENANRAVADSSVMAYLGTFNSGAAKVSMPILNRANLVMVSPSNTYPGLTKPGKGEPSEPAVYRPSGQPNYARVTPADDVQGVAGASWARQLGARRAYVLDDTDLYGHLLASEFAAAQRLGLQVVGGPEGIDPKATDYRALAEKVRAAGPDLVYFGGITQNHAGQLFKDLRAVLGSEAKLMGPDGIYEVRFLRDAGPAAEGVCVTFGGVPPSMLTGKGAEWYQAYRARYNAEPEAYAAYGYDAAKVVLDAIARAGVKDREAVRAAVFATANYDGVLGIWSFDPNGDTTLTTMSGRQVRDGQFDDRNAVILTVD